MHVGRNNPRNKYYMNGVELSVTEEERDLGVWTDSTSLVPLYKSLVRPKMEFAVAAWNPWYDKDIACLEKVQRRLIRSLSNFRGTTYEEKLKDAGLTTLKERCKRGDMIEAFKTLSGKM